MSNRAVPSISTPFPHSRRQESTTQKFAKLSKLKLEHISKSNLAINFPFNTSAFHFCKSVNLAAMFRVAVRYPQYFLLISFDCKCVESTCQGHFKHDEVRSKVHVSKRSCVEPYFAIVLLACTFQTDFYLYIKIFLT